MRVRCTTTSERRSWNYFQCSIFNGILPGQLRAKWPRSLQLKQRSRLRVSAESIPEPSIATSPSTVDPSRGVPFPLLPSCQAALVIQLCQCRASSSIALSF
ncbi:hypothetical protein ARMGADRAFT_362153 [Armillaria gallica]|uniref:Uncharacterized protein n=1 Tax=Armillaria gallica TaxID=47427 RepID=A0A2H3DAY2_ARMGA|nr:hypothetical protein ARMGADRAFT_429016 [Armillaria gallica]PBK88572.1 hypothetical protein ARMGADRAFT_362153 [Armillaria gallica]